MPADLTIFTANYMIFIEAVVALGVVSYALYRGSRDEMLRWLLSAGVTGVVAEILTQIGGVLYRDPRPFAEGHYRPLIAHVADNGFPSDHGLLAAFLVVCVLLTRVWLAVPITATLAILVDWARVGAGIHHPIDVIGSAAFVAIGASIAVAITPFLFHQLSPHLPRVLTGPDPVSYWQQPSHHVKHESELLL